MANSLKILFLCKRYYMGKDVIEDRYGRLYYFPLSLAQARHSVTGLVSDYHFNTSAISRVTVDGVDWVSAPVTSPFAWRREMQQLAQHSDVIMASSDCIQVALGGYLARKYHKPFIADLYDNYESFSLSRAPGIRYLYRKGLRSARNVTCVGEELAGLVRRNFELGGEAVVLNSSIPGGKFYPLERDVARQELGLPAGERLVGICGGLTRNRGIDHFYRAVEELWQDGANFNLVLAGELEKGTSPPRRGKVMLLGSLPFQNMNAFYNAMDVNVMQYIDNAFGRYCYPQKMEEITATEAALVAANVGEMRHRFAATPDLLYQPDDINAIKRTLLRQLEAPVRYKARLQTWTDIGAQLDSLVQRLALGPRG